MIFLAVVDEKVTIIEKRDSLGVGISCLSLWTTMLTELKTKRSVIVMLFDLFDFPRRWKSLESMFLGV